VRYFGNMLSVVVNVAIAFIAVMPVCSRFTNACMHGQWPRHALCVYLSSCI